MISMLKESINEFIKFLRSNGYHIFKEDNICKDINNINNLNINSLNSTETKRNDFLKSNFSQEKYDSNEIDSFNKELILIKTNNHIKQKEKKHIFICDKIKSEDINSSNSKANANEIIKNLNINSYANADDCEDAYVDGKNIKFPNEFMRFSYKLNKEKFNNNKKKFENDKQNYIKNYSNNYESMYDIEMKHHNSIIYTGSKSDTNPKIKNNISMMYQNIFKRKFYPTEIIIGDV